MIHRTGKFALAIGLATVIGGGIAQLARAVENPPNQPTATAVIQGAGDNKDKIKGTAKFVPAESGVKIIVDVDGLSPGKHGIHIHENSDLSAPDLKSAGPHFNPGGETHHHAGPSDAARHAGDLGNIEADANGHGHLEMMDDALTINDPKTGVVGHSVIIHADPDDEQSQPAGKSGARIAGGAILKDNPGGRQP